MSKDIPAVETEDQSAATDPQGVEETGAGAPDAQGDIDYAAEYAALMEENARIARDRDNYRDGLLAAKGKQGDDGSSGQDDSETVAGVVQRELQKIIPTLQSSFASESINSIISELSSDPAEQKLIRHHFENTVTPNGSLRDRLENAKLIANRKSILKSQKEMKVAIQNRSQVTNASQGGGGTPEPTKDKGDGYFSPEQLAHFKRRGLDPKKVKANILKYKL